ncbi:MAG: glycosyl hydrolase family 18 protein [Verrucomicrobiota bacterium]
MKRSAILAMKFFALILTLLLTVTAIGAGWPAKVFVPYMYIGAGDHFQITKCDDACGQKFYTIAFIIDDGHRFPAWDGRFPLASNLYQDQINEIRKRGGNVIVSFGGGGGTELALAEPDTNALAAKYQSVIDRYQLTWLDFDIEGDALAKSDVNRRRNAVLAKLQAKNPGLIISFTLPVDPDGIPKDGLELLDDARAQGVKVYSANVMTMDYGAQFARGKRMCDVAIASALKAREQCEAIDPNIQIGLTPMIGNNDEKGQVFTLDDAEALRNWAETQPWICSLSFWASNRDNGKPTDRQDDNTTSGIKQDQWDFTKTFKPFTTTH